MKKRKICYILIGGISLLIIFSSILFVRRSIFTNTIFTLPSMELFTLKRNVLYTNIYKRDNMDLLVVFFHPECEFCALEMKELLEHKFKLENMQLLFVTFASINEIESYILKYPIDKLKNATIAIDTHGEFAERFKIKAPPTIIIYNKEGKLKKIFRGAVPVKKIIKYLD